MAISDYCIDYVTSVDNIINDLNDNQIDLEKYFDRPKHTINNKTKISSNQKDLIIKLKQAPKIIGLIKDISPKTNLIGFKLLDNVTNEYLIEVAQNLAKKNNCNYVIANDMKHIKNGEHKAFVVTKEDVIGEEIIGKENIVNKIIELIK
jgi:phosphopantothenate-cysteine ligase